jgi:hypothetical protein
MGPISAKTYPGEEWIMGRNRATFEQDDGRRGKLWVHGAFEPVTGQGTILLSPSCDSASYIRLIEKIVTALPADCWLIIGDNLSIHTNHQTRLALAAWPEIRLQFIRKHACWLNMIEPWWKQLRSLALKGRCFETLDELSEALDAALDYSNVQRHPYHWKKKLQEQMMILGGFSVVHNALEI